MHSPNHGRFLLDFSPARRGYFFAAEPANDAAIPANNVGFRPLGPGSRAQERAGRDTPARVPGEWRERFFSARDTDPGPRATDSNQASIGCQRRRDRARRQNREARQESSGRYPTSRNWRARRNWP